MTTISRIKPPELARLEVAGPLVLGQLRQAFADLVSGLPARPVRASALADTLGIDRSLGWKIWRVAQGRDAVPSPKHVPGRNGITIFLNAAERCGAPAEMISAAEQAYDAFENLARVHAGDRAGAEIVFGGMTHEGRQRLEISLRRAAFRANTHFLGVQARTLVRTALVFPGPPGYAPNFTSIRGHFGLWRTRADQPWVVGQSAVIKAETLNKITNYQRRPIDPRVSEGDVPLWQRFCSQPLPKVRRLHTPTGLYEDELAAGPIGQAAAVDLVVGEHLRNMPLGTIGRVVISSVTTPVEHFCCELLLHRDVWDGQAPDLIVHTHMHGVEGPTRTERRDELVVPERLEHLGPADRFTAAAEVPHHREIVDAAFTELNLDPSAFSVFRVRMQYPPIPIGVSIGYELPPSLMGTI